MTASNGATKSFAYTTPTEIGTLVGSVLVGVGAVLGLWRRASKTNLEVKQDSSSGRRITDVERDRDMWRERSDRDRENLLMLTGINESQRRELDLMRADMSRAILQHSDEVEALTSDIRRLARIVSRLRPDLAELMPKSWLEPSGWAPLEEGRGPNPQIDLETP